MDLLEHLFKWFGQIAEKLGLDLLKNLNQRWAQAYFMFAADAADIVRGEFFVMWRKFRSREILDVEKYEMWRN